MSDERDDLVLLLAEMKAQSRKSTKSAVWDEVVERTKKKILKMYDRASKLSTAKYVRRHKKLV
jgi:hypothetical protein